MNKTQPITAQADPLFDPLSPEFIRDPYPAKFRGGATSTNVELETQV